MSTGPKETTGEIAKRPETERQVIINKKGETAFVSAEKFFKENGQGKTQNTRLAYKLNKMFDCNSQFLITEDLATIKKGMEFHTFIGFEERINNIVHKIAKIDSILNKLKEKISSTQSDKVDFSVQDAFKNEEYLALLRVFNAASMEKAIA